MKRLESFLRILFIFPLALALVSLSQPAVKVLKAGEEPITASSAELINKAWAAHGRRNIEATFKYTQQVIDLYKDKADKDQAGLRSLPKSKDEIEDVRALNDVATAYFIQAESYLRQDKPKEAKQLLELVVSKYPFAQAWDQRGWFWSIKTAAEQTIKKIETGSIEVERKEGKA